MDNWQIAAGVGVVIFVFGAAMMRWHVASWRRQKNDASLDDFDRNHYFARYRRRMQTSGIIALLGILIPVGDSLLSLQNFPALFAVYWGTVLLLTLWIVLLAVGDVSSTKAHSNVALERLRQKQRELQAHAKRLKSRRSNGHPPETA